MVPRRIEDERPVEAFGVHRHDVLNGLQLIRAYIQLGRMDQALRSVDDLAEWLKSLSLWQRLETGDGELVWTAARCSHVRLVSVADVSVLSAAEAVVVCEAWSWLEEQAVTRGLPAFSVSLRRMADAVTDTTVDPEFMMGSAQLEAASARRDDGMSGWLILRIDASPAIREWWESIRTQATEGSRNLMLFNVPILIELHP